MNAPIWSNIERSRPGSCDLSFKTFEIGLQRDFSKTAAILIEAIRKRNDRRNSEFYSGLLSTRFNALVTNETKSVESKWIRNKKGIAKEGEKQFTQINFLDLNGRLVNA